MALSAPQNIQIKNWSFPRELEDGVYRRPYRTVLQPDTEQSVSWVRYHHCRPDHLQPLPMSLLRGGRSEYLPTLRPSLVRYFG